LLAEKIVKMLERSASPRWQRKPVALGKKTKELKKLAEELRISLGEACEEVQVLSAQAEFAQARLCELNEETEEEESRLHDAEAALKRERQDIETIEVSLHSAGKERVVVDAERQRKILRDAEHRVRQLAKQFRIAASRKQRLFHSIHLLLAFYDRGGAGNSGSGIDMQTTSADDAAHGSNNGSGGAGSGHVGGDVDSSSSSPFGAKHIDVSSLTSADADVDVASSSAPALAVPSSASVMVSLDSVGVVSAASAAAAAAAANATMSLRDDAVVVESPRSRSISTSATSGAGVSNGGRHSTFSGASSSSVVAAKALTATSGSAAQHGATGSQPAAAESLSAGSVRAAEDEQALQEIASAAGLAADTVGKKERSVAATLPPRVSRRAADVEALADLSDSVAAAERERQGALLGALKMFVLEKRCRAVYERSLADLSIASELASANIEVVDVRGTRLLSSPSSLSSSSRPLLVLEALARAFKNVRAMAALSECAEPTDRRSLLALADAAFAGDHRLLCALKACSRELANACAECWIYWLDALLPAVHVAERRVTVFREQEAVIVEHRQRIVAAASSVAAEHAAIEIDSTGSSSSGGGGGGGVGGTGTDASAEHSSDSVVLVAAKGAALRFEWLVRVHFDPEMLDVFSVECKLAQSTPVTVDTSLASKKAANALVVECTAILHAMLTSATAPIDTDQLAKRVRKVRERFARMRRKDSVHHRSSSGHVRSTSPPQPRQPTDPMDAIAASPPPSSSTGGEAPSSPTSSLAGAATGAPATAGGSARRRLASKSQQYYRQSVLYTSD
jgi:hypothetical protein